MAQMMQYTEISNVQLLPPLVHAGVSPETPYFLSPLSY